MEPMLPVKPSRQATGWVLASVVAVVAVLHFAEDVLVPVAMAVLLAFLLAPLVSRAERWGANRAAAVGVTTLVAFALIGALAYAVAQQFLGLVDDLPSYRDNLIAKIQSVSSNSSDGGIQRGVESMKELTDELKKTTPGRPDSPDIPKVQVVEPPPNVAQVVSGLFGPLIGPVSTAGIVVVFVIFMLLQREDLRDRLVRLLGARDMHVTLTALDDAAGRVSRYLLMQTLINAVQGALVATGLYLIGVPEALMWGSLTVVLRFIPYLGPMLAAVGPIVLSLAFFNGWEQPLMVIGLILTLELISNNILEPRLYGSSVGVSSFALIVAAVFWTWLWGAAGLFLATPLTVCLVVLGKYIPQLAFLGVMLGDQPVLEPSERFYQRLLANDPDEAQILLDDAIETGSLVDACDAMLLPALRFAEQDHDRGAIDDARRNRIIEQIGEMIDDLPGGSKAADDGGSQPEQRPAVVARMTVMCLPAADLADEKAARLLDSLLAPLGIEVEVLPAATLKSEMLAQALRIEPNVILVSATPPAAVIHARYLCKKLRLATTRTPIVVALWDAQGDLSMASERLRAAGASTVISNAAGAVQELSVLYRTLLQGVRVEDRSIELAKPVVVPA